MMIDFDIASGIYLHIPFCQQKCRYCDFFSIKYDAEIINTYVKFLKKEIKIHGLLINNNTINTIYLGGGTPSLLSSTQISSILNHINKYFSIKKGAEITLEANPISLSKKKIRSYNIAGINRISLGVQSFSDKILKFLGRLHDASRVKYVLEEINKVFDNYSLDLMFAIPGQELSNWKESLQNAIFFNPTHISLYNLEIDKDTEIGRLIKNGEISTFDEDLDANMYIEAREYLSKNGYNQYEISSFSKPSFRSKHNQIYWRYEPFLGMGAAAHGFTGKKRYYNYSNVEKYINLLKDGRLAVEELINLNKEELIAEKMIMNLRLLEGISCSDFIKFSGYSLDDYFGEKIKKLQKNGLLLKENNRLKLSEKGLMLGNQVFLEFLAKTFDKDL